MCLQSEFHLPTFNFLVSSLFHFLFSTLIHLWHPLAPCLQPASEDYRKEWSASNCRGFFRSYQPQYSCVAQVQPKPGRSPDARFKHCSAVETQLLNPAYVPMIRAWSHVSPWQGNGREVLLAAIFEWIFSTSSTQILHKYELIYFSPRVSWYLMVTWIKEL